jgi:hypothetical protein
MPTLAQIDASDAYPRTYVVKADATGFRLVDAKAGRPAQWRP